MCVEYFDEEKALAEMLLDGVLFCNGRKYIKEGLDGRETEVGPETIVLFVNCNDVFAWACADCENLPNDEIENLYNFWKQDKVYGPMKWCCKQRGYKPQEPIREEMKKVGVWDDMMENLKDNPN